MGCGGVEGGLMEVMMEYCWEDRSFAGEEGGVGDIVGRENERLTDGAGRVIGFHTDALTHPGSAVQDGSALAAMGIGVAGLGLRDRSGSWSCMGDGSEESNDDRGGDGLHFGRIGVS